MATTFIKKIIALALVLSALSACSTIPASTPTANAPSIEMSYAQRNFINGGADYFPGGTGYYNFGAFNDKEYYKSNVVISQKKYDVYKVFEWKYADVGGFGNFIGNTFYMPLSVRWQLKDGRQFVIKNIDIQAIMREYFKSNVIKLDFEKEYRAQNVRNGDNNPTLGYEIQQNTLKIKWIVTHNIGPSETRANPYTWKFSNESFPVTTLQAREVTGLDFKNVIEPKD